MTHLTFFILNSDTQYIRSGKMHAYVFPTQTQANDKKNRLAGTSKTKFCLFSSKI